MVRMTRGTYPSDIVINIGRWVLIVLVGSLVAHIPLPIQGSVLRDLPLMAAALVFWLGDALTLPAVLAPITGEKPWTIILSSIREGGAAEAGQYLTGILGVLLAMQQVWALLMLIVPAGLVCLAYKKEVDSSAFNLLEGLADTVDLRDPNTGGHSHRVATLVQRALGELGMHGPEARQIITAARLHDIGKIAMPDSVLQKPGPLCEEEWMLIQTCPDQAEELLRDYPDFARGIEMVRHHHERWDGAGYPRQLATTEIPFGARLIAIADSYDAMTSDRPYRKGMSAARAAEILRSGSGTQWEPRIVEAFLDCMKDQTNN